MFDVLSSLNTALRGSPAFGALGARPAPETTELARPPERREAPGLGDEIFRAVKDALKAAGGFGAGAEMFDRMADELRRQISAEPAMQSFGAPRVPMGFAAGERVSMSLEIESLSFSMSEDGKSFSMSYTRVSISMVSERYVAGLGASPEQLADFFDDNPLALPARKKDDDDPLKQLLNVLVPLDKRFAKDPFGLFA